jgi:hypothetical protein
MQMPQSKRETVQEMNKIFAVDAAVFMRCFDIREGKDKLSGKEVIDVFKKYLREVEKACHIIDGL